MTVNRNTKPRVARVLGMMLGALFVVATVASCQHVGEDITQGPPAPISSAPAYASL